MAGRKRAKAGEPKASAVRALVAEAEKKVVKGRARAEALLRLIERRKQRITEDFYDIGEARRELYRKALFRSLDCATKRSRSARKRRTRSSPTRRPPPSRTCPPSS